MPDAVDYRRLIIPERVRLVQEIWDSIVDDGPPVSVSRWQQVELDRRLEELVRSRDDVQSWSEVRAEIESESDE